MDYTWTDYDEGNSVGQLGSEGGMIIRDEENTFGARVTLEGKGHVAPFSITLGIYGVMLHTEFFADLEQGQEHFNLYKRKIEEIINHYAIRGLEPDKEWSKKFNQLLSELCY